MIWRRIAGLLVSVGLAGCGAHTAPAVAPAAPAAPATTPSLVDVEAALRAAPAWRADVEITATGAISASIAATVLVAPGGKVRIEATGALMTHPVDLTWVADGTRTSTAPTVPAALTEATAIGIVRMGLLHNLARLSAGAAPDHAEGGAATWVVARDAAPLPGGELGYRLVVDGKDSADVVVAIDPAGPVLTRRRITVHFDEGDMVVEERYRFDLAPTLAADAFVIR